MAISITIPAFAKDLCVDACTGHVFNATAGSSQLCLDSLPACSEPQGLSEVRDCVKQLPFIVSRNTLGQNSLHRSCPVQVLRMKLFQDTNRYSNTDNFLHMGLSGSFKSISAL